MLWIAVLSCILVSVISLVLLFRRSMVKSRSHGNSTGPAGTGRGPRSHGKSMGHGPSLSLIPSPPRHWLSGHIPLLMDFMKTGKHIDELICQLHHQLHSRIIKLSLGFKDIIAVYDPDALKEVCVNFNLPKAPYASIRAFLGGQSILLSNGDEWQRTRRAFAPGFSYSHLKQCLPDFCQKATFPHTSPRSHQASRGVSA